MRQAADPSAGAPESSGLQGGTDATRMRILEEARSLFLHYGYSKANISDIARACEMSPANLYRYFRNKQAIGFGVIAQYMAAEEAELAAALAQPGLTPEERLRKVLSAGVFFVVERLRSSPRIVELADFLFSTDDGAALIAEAERRHIALVTGLIEDGVAQGAFTAPDPERAARAMLLGVKYFQVPFGIVRHGLDQVEEDLEIILDLLCTGLRRD